jgi:peptide deformylase
MAKLTILEYPDPRLRTRAAPVARFDEALHRLVDDMFETMYAAPGIGLAATQVNVHKRLLVTDVSQDKSHPLVFINPEIVERQGTTEAEEGCLSVPKIFETLTARAERIVVRAFDRHGQPFELEADGLLAVCIQHEIDHLEGKLFVDYLSELKRTRIRKKLEKDRRDRAARPAGAEGSRAPVI